MIALRIFVPGPPVPQPRQRHALRGKHVVNYTPAKHPVNEYKARVRGAAAEAMAKHGVGMIQGPVYLWISFVMPRPASMMWKTKPMPAEHHTKKPDLDNLLKSVKDAMTGVVWRDDSQVAMVEASKRIAGGDEKPGTSICVRELE